MELSAGRRHSILTESITCTVTYRDPHESDTKLLLHYRDLTGGTGLRQVIESVRTDEVYNLSSQLQVKVSFSQPEYRG